MLNLFSGRIGGRLFPRRLSSPQRPLFLITLALIPIALWCVPLAATSPVPYSLRKQEARTQFDKAEQLREELNGRPATERTRQDYKHVIDAYRKVYYVAPTCSKADASVVAVAELDAEMGRTFVPGEKELRAAITEYQFLRREYPGSKYRFEALFTIGQIYRQDLTTMPQRARLSRNSCGAIHTHSLVVQARQELAELDHPKSAKKPPVDEAHIQPPPPPDPGQATSRLFRWRSARPAPPCRG